MVEKPYDFSQCSDLINMLKNINIEQTSTDTLIRSRLNKIKLQAYKPLCAEQIILILIEILTLKHNYKINSVEILKLHPETFKPLKTPPLEFDPKVIFVLINSILPLLLREKNLDLYKIFRVTILDFSFERRSTEEEFFKNISKLCNTHISGIDIDVVMQAAVQVRKSKETLNKNAILVVGETGVGKSLIIKSILYPSMFSRSFMGGKLEINYKDQPTYLKRIQIGEGALSKTSKMSVIDVSNSTALEKFHNKNYAICDTPGSDDNRLAEGSELILANSLETIIPMYKASSVRFLVLFSSTQQTTSRGGSLRKTIQFVSKMFHTIEHLKTTAESSMMFAVNIVDGNRNLDQFKFLLEDFLKQSTAFKLSKNDIELIKILQKKFNSNEVLLIEPGKEKGKSEEIMTRLDKLVPATPKEILTPFAEVSLQSVLEQEVNLLTNSIKQILVSLQYDLSNEMKSDEALMEVIQDETSVEVGPKNISTEVMKIQVRKLVQKLDKLNFIIPYSSNSPSTISSFFEPLAKLVSTFRAQALSILCPANNKIDPAKVKKGIEILERLNELDQAIKILVMSFNDSRELALSLITCFDKAIKAPANFKSMNEEEWLGWIQKNSPKPASQDIEYEIKRHRITLGSVLDVLINIQLKQIHLQKVQNILSFQSTNLASIPHAIMVNLDKKHYSFSEFVRKNLGGHLSEAFLRQYETSAKKLASSMQVYCKNFSLETILSEVVGSLSIQKQEEKLKKILFNEDGASNVPVNKLNSSGIPSAPGIPGNSNENHETSAEDRERLKSLNILDIQFDEMTKQLLQEGTDLILGNNFVMAVNVIDTFDKMVDLFGCVSPEGLQQLKQYFQESFAEFVKWTVQLINDSQPFNEDNIQTLLLNLHIIANTRQLEAFSKCTLYPASPYSSPLQVQLDSLSTTLESRFGGARTLINGVCSQSFNASNFISLDQQIQQLWYLLSLPCDNHAAFVSEYSKITAGVSAYCMNISGQLIGRLQANSVSPPVYSESKAFIQQLQSLPMANVLDLKQAYISLQDTLNQRALVLINGVNQIDLSLNFGDQLIGNASFIEEILILRRDFNGNLPETTLTELQQTLDTYHSKVWTTLQNIGNSFGSLIEDLARNDAEIPAEHIIKVRQYLNSCQYIWLYDNEVLSLHKGLQEFVQQYVLTKNNSNNRKLAELQPTAESFNILLPDKIVATMEQLGKLKQNVAELYENCGDPIQDLADSLHSLVLDYQTALNEALAKATAGKMGHHEVLLVRVSQLQKLDVYLKNSIKKDEKSINFKKLYKRFENAFNVNNFSKLKDIMSAVFDGHFDQAQKLVLENADLAPATDMRALLVDQIGVYISASIANVERYIKQLTSKPIPRPDCMQDLLKNYHRINAAQSLVDAGLLESTLLTKRAQLLSETQFALDQWFTAIIKTIDNHIQNLDLKAAHADIDALSETLKSMSLKPTNADARITQVKDRLHAKSQQCVEQYQQPVAQWTNNTYGLAKIAKAFLAVENLPYRESTETYSQRWTSLSAQIYHTLDNECTEIEKNFNNNGVDLKSAVTRLEEFASITNDVPLETSNFSMKIKQRYQAAATKIETDIIESTQEEVREKHIQDLLNASNRFEKLIGSHSFERAQKLIFEKAKGLRIIISQTFNTGAIPSDELILFASLYQKFSSRFDFLKQDCASYADKLKVLVSHALENVKNGGSFYKNGSDPTTALQQIHGSLIQLIEVQRLSKNTHEMAPLVDKNLPNEVVPQLVEIKQLLLSNYEAFKTALSTRNIADLNNSLKVASAFETVTLSIREYINACPFTSVSSLDELKQLSEDFSYSGLRDMLIEELKSIYSGLHQLNRTTLKDETKEAREKFYISLRGNIEFIQALSDLSQHVKVESSDYGLGGCLSQVSSFVAKEFHEAHQQLKMVSTPSISDNWSAFNRHYQELLIFSDRCGTSCLGRLKISGLSSEENLNNNESIEASLLFTHLNKTFDHFLDNVIAGFKAKFQTASADDENINNELVALLSGLQKMAEDVTVMNASIKEKLRIFLQDIKSKRPGNYILFLATQLRNAEGGFGAKIVAQQSLFAGIATAERNRLTKSQNIDYVLENIKIQDKITGEVRFLHDGETQQLRSQYLEFEKEFDSLLEAHTSKANFLTHKKVYLERLKNDLLDLIKNNQPQKDASTGRIIWDAQVVQLLPKWYASLFAIWTLNESSAFFDSINADKEEGFLKKPHPAQLIAIFLMLNTLGAKSMSGLPGMLDEVLTGEGKSVVLAATSSLLALLGFDVHVGCYSEYLSGRDEEAFKWFTDLLDVSQYIQYGTFNRLSEEMLNRGGNLRDLLENILLNAGNKIESKIDNGREKIALTDEIDSLVTAFFGHMYQPYFLLQGQEIDDLIDIIYTRHTHGGISLNDVKNLPAYQACFKKYSGLEYIIRYAVVEMLRDLERYKRKDGHDFYVSNEGDIYYKHFDGTTMSKSIGYRTLWACMDKENPVSEACAKKHKGIKINCGAFSYAHLMRDQATYRTMLGVTGTYRELSEPEKMVVKEVFGIEGASFIPSAYGKNNLQFNPGDNNDFLIVEDTDYNRALWEQIVTRQRGSIAVNERVRPVLVFFETEEDLEVFYNSPEFAAHKDRANKMTSKLSKEERDTFITQATREGAITLALEEYGRGNDFILTDTKIILNNGMAAMDGYMPATAAEQRQHQGRAARQGQKGSFNMVIKKSEIINKFGLTEEEIEQARKNGKLYEVVTTARDEKFAKGYQQIKDQTPELVKLFHEPSKELLKLLRDSATDSSADLKKKIIATHRKILNGGKAEVEMKESKVLILFDSTGSMGNLIKALKSTLAEVVESLTTVLKKEINATFQLQIAHYKDYDSYNEALNCTKQWSCDPQELKKFIGEVYASGGGRNESECLELGLNHANKLADTSGLNYVMVFGDEPPTRKKEMEALRNEFGWKVQNKNGAFFEARHYRKEIEDLAVKNIPVSTFIIETGRSQQNRTEKTFKRIAETTNGEYQILNLNDSEKAKQEVTSLFAKKVITTVVQDTEHSSRVDELYEKFFQQYSKN